MIPGPVEVGSEALDRLSHPIQPHYGDEWMEIFNSTIKKLKKVFSTSNDIIIFAGTGSAAIESAISSTLEPNDKVLVCQNGYFSERLVEMITSWGGVPIIIKSEMNQAIDPTKVLETLKKDKEIKLMVLVHVETSTGVENPVKEICKIAKSEGLMTLVDSIAGLGGSELLIDNWEIDFAATASQKCLESPAGLSFLSISSKAWEVILSNTSLINGWYLSLKNIKKYQKKFAEFRHSHGPNTAPVSLYMALNCSLDKILKEGLKERIKRHEKMAKLVRKTLESIGINLFVCEKFACNTLTSFVLPDNINASQFLNLMRHKYNILLSGDVGQVDKQLIRFGHMGISATPEYLLPTFIAIERSLEELGFDFKNKGVEKIFSDLI